MLAASARIRGRRAVGGWGRAQAEERAEAGGREDEEERKKKERGSRGKQRAIYRARRAWAKQQKQSKSKPSQKPLPTCPPSPIWMLACLVWTRPPLPTSMPCHRPPVARPDVLRAHSSAAFSATRVRAPARSGMWLSACIEPARRRARIGRSRDACARPSQHARCSLRRRPISGSEGAHRDLALLCAGRCPPEGITSGSMCAHKTARPGEQPRPVARPRKTRRRTCERGKSDESFLVPEIS